MLAGVLAVALWPAAAHARIDAGRADTEQPRLWGVEIGTHAGTFARPTYLARMKHAGINAVVVDPRRLTLKDLRATVKAAKGARLWVIELIPPAHAKATRSVKAVRATCRAPRKPAQTLCAASTASPSAAIALSRSGSAGSMVAVRLAGPAQVARLRGVSSSGLQILALVKLRAHRFATSAWRKAIGVAATTSSLDLAVTPTGSSNQTLSPYLNQLGKPPGAPASFAVTGSTASTISVAWAAVVGATEYNITANGKFAGKTATTSFTVGGLACSTAYKLAVTAKNAAGKTSKASTLMASTASCSDTTPPTVAVTAPTADATVSGNVSVTASASDNVGLARVEFWVDGVQEAADASPPYSYGWDTTQDAGGPHTILAKAFDTSNNSASETIGVTVSNSPCVTSSASWQNTAMLSPDGTFDVSFDATPSAGNVDAVTGLSAAAALAYSDLAVTARFNSSGSIDAINGGGYAATNTVPYAGGSTYHFRAAVNVPSHTYSLYVTPPGKPETPVALNYAFRTGQGAVSALSNWAVTAADGSHQTCGLAVTNPTDMTAPSAPTGLAKTSSTQTSLSLSWAASTDNVGDRRLHGLRQRHRELGCGRDVADDLRPQLRQHLHDRRRRLRRGRQPFRADEHDDVDQRVPRRHDTALDAHESPPKRLDGDVGDRLLDRVDRQRRRHRLRRLHERNPGRLTDQRPATPSPASPAAPATPSPSTPPTQPATAQPNQHQHSAPTPAPTRPRRRRRRGSPRARSARPRSRSPGRPRATTWG